MEDVNQRYYGALTAGREDYWRRMAAPRFRVRTFTALLERDHPRTLVDLGCGNGQLLHELRGHLPGTELVGVDLSPAQIEANRRALPDVRFHALDLTSPAPLDDALAGRFDAVVAMELIEHLHDPAALLRTARALATPGHGRLYLSTQSGPVRETERRVGHLLHFSREAMTELLRGAGWEVERVWNAGFPFHDLSKWAANLRPDAVMERFGERRYGFVEQAVCFALRGAFQLNSQSSGAQLFAVARAP